MFEQTFVETGARRRSPWALTASFLAQTLLVLAALSAPLLRPATLALLTRPALLLLPAARRPEPVPAEARPHATLARPVFRLTGPAFAVANRAPSAAVSVSEAPEVSFPGAASGGADAFAALSIAPAPLPPPPPQHAAPKPVAPAVLRVSAGVQEAKLIFKVKPVYPALARQARVEGAVHLQATIARDGRIANLQLLDGHPLLVGAALDAVRQWRYSPTLLGSEPVEVLTQITVNFILSR